jgi:hypothetical protein
VPSLATRLAVGPVALLRTTAVGAGAGAAIGGAIETDGFPIVGTFFGAIEGAVIGAGIGLILGLVLLGCGVFTPAPGARRFRLAHRPDQLAVGALIGRTLAVGSIAGGGLGGIAGLIVGLASYPPTAAFAGFEAGILCAVSAVVVALPVAAALVARRVRLGR